MLPITKVNFKFNVYLSVKVILSSPVLTLLTGVGGSGKTTFCKGLVDVETKKVLPGLIDRFLNMIYIGKDEIADHYTHHRGLNYQKQIRKTVYDRVYEETESVLRTGKNVLIDASFNSQLIEERWYESYHELATKYDYKMKLIRLIPTADRLFQQITKRKSSYDKHKDTTTAKNLWDWYEKNEPIDTTHLPSDHLSMKLSGDFEFDIARLIDYLKY